jgi:hypothetical protein
MITALCDYRFQQVAVRIEPVEDGIVSLSFVVRNVAGPGYPHLLALGDD